MKVWAESKWVEYCLNQTGWSRPQAAYIHRSLGTSVEDEPFLGLLLHLQKRGTGFNGERLAWIERKDCPKEIANGVTYFLFSVTSKMASHSCGWTFCMQEVYKARESHSSHHWNQSCNICWVLSSALISPGEISVWQTVVPHQLSTAFNHTRWKCHAIIC